MSVPVLRILSGNEGCSDMAKRRYADFLGDGEESPPGDLKPRADGPRPSRAWFEHAEDPSLGAWRVTVEHEQRFATNHQGTFHDLVQLARQAGVTEYYVWSPKDADFTLFSEQTVTESE
jgi:hypothetical protein